MTETAPDLLPEGSLTAGVSRRALDGATANLGLSADSAELIRLGSNAVYRLPGQVVARVSCGSAALSSAALQIDVAAWLEAHGYPATRTVGSPQPQVSNGCVVTCWRSVADETIFPPLREIAGLIKRLHALPPPEFALPELAPFDGIGDRIDALKRAVPREDYDAVLDRLISTREQFFRLKFPDVGPIHGDANIGNTLVDSKGVTVLIDLDNFATGPREWDHIKTAVYYDRFGWHSDGEYSDYCAVIGFDPRDSPRYETLALAVELLMTLWLSKNAANDKKSADETKKRTRAIRMDLPRTDWLPY